MCVCARVCVCVCVCVRVCMCVCNACMHCGEGVRPLWGHISSSLTGLLCVCVKAEGCLM